METLALDAPQTIGDTGIRPTLLEDLALKSLYLNGEMSLLQLAEQTCLSLAVVEELFQFFRREQLCEVKGMVRGTHLISASASGRERAAASFALSQYSGPAPISLDDYSAHVRAQSVQHTHVGPADLARAFENMVLSEELLARLGTAVVSGRSVFLYGPPGTGKTTLACNIPSIYDDFVLIPQAIEVDGQIISVYDPGVHRAAPDSIPEEWDRRWVLCLRPRVVAGGELSSEMLDVQFNASTRFFTAPLQLKANNGIFVLDDFGRQRMRSDELLNRWMTPLDRRVDFLTLPGGKKFEVPFDVLVVFSTNIDPRTLADDAFLRRIPNKIQMDYASPRQFAKIFRRECAACTLPSEEDLADYAAEFISKELKQPLCHCYAADIVAQVLWSAKFRGVEPQLTRSAFQEACRNYFLQVQSA
jgi:hypothetical protein